MSAALATLAHRNTKFEPSPNATRFQHYICIYYLCIARICDKSPTLCFQGRSDTPPEKGNTALRNMLTYVLAGLMGKEDCKHRLLCELGNLIQPVRGKAVLFM